MGIALALVMAACVTSPTGRRQLKLFPASDVAQMGLKAYQDVLQKTPVSRDAGINGYVRCVADALIRVVGPPSGGGRWDVTVFRADQTVNAFALPGGGIGVYTGIVRLAASPAQLAAVIGHEMGHVEAGHANERISQQLATQTGLQLIQTLAGGTTTPGSRQLMSLLGLGAQVGILLPYSRAQESEADLLGLRYMAQAGFDPHAAPALWQRMTKRGGSQPPEFLSTHPSNESRIRTLEERVPRVMPLYDQARAAGRAPRCTRPAGLPGG